MKSILILLTLTVLLFSACEVKNTVTVELSRTSSTEFGLVTNDKHIRVIVKNTTDQEATIQWDRTETQAVTGWTYDVNGSAAATGTLTIPANTSKEVVLMVTPNGTLGTGSGTLNFYDAADPSLTSKVFSYTLTTLNSYFRIVPQGFTSQSVRMNAPAADYHLWIINDNTIPLDVQWARTNEASNPAAWEVAICTQGGSDSVCYAPTIITENVTITPGDSMDFKATIDHQATTGNGGTTPIFWIPTDSINSVLSETFTHEVVL